MRFSPGAVVRGYEIAVALAYASIVVGVGFGVLPLPTLAMLLTIPLARDVRQGLLPNYDNPYALMAVMARNIKVHAYAGLLLLGAYAIVLLAQAVAPSLDLFLG